MAALGSDATYGVPGPTQVIWLPSPMFHTTLDGAAVAVADTVPALAVALHRVPSTRLNPQPCRHTHQLLGPIGRSHFDRWRGQAQP